MIPKTLFGLLATWLVGAVEPCRIDVVEKGSGWPVPLVELRTTHNVRLVTDNAGVIAFDLPELMGRETWFDVIGHGYECARDGFGYRGVRLKPEPGGRLRVEVNRRMPAKRLGRLTGGGLFAEIQKLGGDLDWRESGVLGCDSVQNAVHRGKLFWAWGDTTMANYPLGIFDMTSATTAIRPLAAFEPPMRLKFDYFVGPRGIPRGVAKMPGSGPTWVSGYVSLPDHTGMARLVGTYVKIKPPMDAYETGLCVWNEATSNFERHRTYPLGPYGILAEAASGAGWASGILARCAGQGMGALWQSVPLVAVSDHLRRLAGPQPVGEGVTPGEPAIGGGWPTGKTT